MKKLLFVIILFIQILLFGQSLELNSHQAYYRSTFNPTLREISLVSNLERLVVNIDSQKIVNVKIWSDTEKKEQPIEEVVVNDESYFVEYQGGGVYKFYEGELIRVDHSFTHKMQINSTLFPYNDTIYRYGGYGFWSTRNFFVYFDQTISEWAKVEPYNSKLLPPGTIDSQVQVIEDDVYVYGGIEFNSFNSEQRFYHDALWKYNIPKHTWELLGRLKIDFNLPNIMYGDKRIFFAENLNEVYIVDIQNNEIEVYEKTIFQQKLSKFISSIYFDGSFYCFQWVDIKSELHFSIRGEDEFFGPLIRKEKLYYNNELTFLLLKLSSILMVIIGALFFIRNYIKNRDKIFIYKDQVKYRGAVITDNEIKAKIIRLLLITDGFVSSSQIMDICENKNQNYAHNTRVKNALIEKINYILKSALKIKADIIISKLSVEDKRIKVYEIDKSYFVLK